jgi:hypothetical protein
MRAVKSFTIALRELLQRNVSHVEEVPISCWFLKTRTLRLSYLRSCARKRCARAVTRAMIA